MRVLLRLPPEGEPFASIRPYNPKCFSLYNSFFEPDYGPARPLLESWMFRGLAVRWHFCREKGFTCVCRFCGKAKLCFVKLSVSCLPGTLLCPEGDGWRVKDMRTGGFDAC